MRNTIRRVEKLEQAFGVGAAQDPPQVIRVVYVEPNGEVTPGYDVVVGQPDGGADPSEPRAVNRTEQ